MRDGVEYSCNGSPFPPHRRGYQDKYLRTIFACLVKAGFVDTALHTSVEAASHAVHHALVGHVHMTGGKATHDAIVWGPAKARCRPSL